MSVYTEKLQQINGRTSGTKKQAAEASGQEQYSADEDEPSHSVQHDSVQHDSVQHDSVQHDSVQHDSVQHDSGAGTGINPGQDVADDLDAGDVEERARIRLQHSPYRAIRRVGCIFSEGTLTLSGFVPTYHYKQLAQTAVSEIGGVKRIVNRIDVG